MDKKHPKTIQIYLPDGNPSGVKIAEITSRDPQVIVVPRALYTEAMQQQYLKSQPAAYVLFGEKESGKTSAYVGETGNGVTRLQNHRTMKDFWTVALLATSKSQSFTKEHVGYLEWLYDRAARDSGRYVLQNNSVKEPQIPDWRKADILDHFEAIRMLFSALGYPVFESLRKTDAKKVYCKGKEAKAEGEYTEDGLVVFKGSTANLEETNSASEQVRKIRNDLRENGILLEENGIYVFQKDHVFSAPSAAASAVLGRNANGWTEWKYASGKTLDEEHRG